MNTQPQFKQFSYKVPAGGSIEVNREGQFFICLEATRQFAIAFDDNPATDFLKGLVYQSDKVFFRIRIENKSEAEMQIEFGIGRGGVRDNRLILPSALDTFNKSPASAAALPAAICDPLTVVEIVPANDLRSEVMIYNSSVSYGIWVRPENLQENGGIYIGPKQTATLQTSAALYAVNDGAGGAGATVTLNGIEMLRGDA